MFNASESVHTCVDWDALMRSAAGRVVGKDEIWRLKNPLLDSSSQLNIKAPFPNVATFRSKSYSLPRVPP